MKTQRWNEAVQGQRNDSDGENCLLGVGKLACGFRTIDAAAGRERRG